MHVRCMATVLVVMTRDNAVMYYVTQVDTIEVQVRRGNVIE